MCSVYNVYHCIIIFYITYLLSASSHSITLNAFHIKIASLGCFLLVCFLAFNLLSIAVLAPQQLLITPLGTLSAGFSFLGSLTEAHIFIGCYRFTGSSTAVHSFKPHLTSLLQLILKYKGGQFQIEGFS